MNITEQAYEITKELLEPAKQGQILVVGCSSSEIMGEKIGTASDVDAAGLAYAGITKACAEKGVYLAAQCCEHLNRAVITDQELADRLNLPKVWVRPVKKAGGSFGTTHYEQLANPCAVEEIKADFGMDIGSTLIGMHLKSVAVPCRTKLKNIGEAYVVCARTRPKYIGGPRAQYEEM